MDSLEENMLPKEQLTKKNILACIISALHLVIIGFVFHIFYLSLSNEWIFFTWHPVLLSIGWVLLMAEGILIFNSYNILPSMFSLSYKLKVQYHWIIQVVGISCSVIGFIIIIIHKNIKEKQHFHTWHSIAGLVTFIFCIPAALSGAVALYGFSLKHYIKPVNSKFIHRVFGIVMFIVGCVAVLLSLYTNWFTRYANEAFVVVWLIIILSIMLLFILQVSNKIYHRLQMLL